MPIQDVTPEEAHALQERDNTVLYLDVRSIPEFDQGHPEGAFNVPLLHFNPVKQQMEPNPDFERVIKAAFTADQRICIGCQRGNRSRRAGEIMERLGFTDLHNVVGGFGGGEDEYGEPIPGWLDCNLPVTRVPSPGRDYEALLARSS